tara:strand:- start:26 stop:262 length:237 start_codon:yes stop_codon:yes gene_type:complete
VYCDTPHVFLLPFLVVTLDVQQGKIASGHSIGQAAPVISRTAKFAYFTQQDPFLLDSHAFNGGFHVAHPKGLWSRPFL